MATIINNSYGTVTCDCPAPVRPEGRAPAATIRAALRRAAETMALWCERAGQRRRLMELDDRMLRDIGINRAAADEEYRKPFWRA